LDQMVGRFLKSHVKTCEWASNLFKCRCGCSRYGLVFFYSAGVESDLLAITDFLFGSSVIPVYAKCFIIPTSQLTQSSRHILDFLDYFFHH
jgi:hypothetical protein